MKGAVVLLGLVAVGSAQMGQMKEMLKGIDMYNFWAKCWGEANIDKYAGAIEVAKADCMQMESPFDHAMMGPRVNPFNSSPMSNRANNIFRQLQSGDHSQLQSLWRSKRAVGDHASGILQPDEDDLWEFLGQVGDFKSSMMTKMGNLTCVMQKMNELNEDRSINIDEYTTRLTNQEWEDFDWTVEGSAVADAEWRKKMSDCNMDCYKLSQNWPQSSLNRNPLTKMFGRHMIFFKCTHKMERKMCAEAQLLGWLIKKYGEPEDMEAHLDKLGLPKDKYDAAAISIAVMHSAASDEEKFVDNFMWGMAADNM